MEAALYFFMHMVKYKERRRAKVEETVFFQGRLT